MSKFVRKQSAKGTPPRPQDIRHQCTGMTVPVGCKTVRIDSKTVKIVKI